MPSNNLFVLDANGNKVPLPPSGGGSGAQRGLIQSLSSNLTAVNAKATEALAAALAAQADATQALADALSAQADATQALANAATREGTVVFPDATASGSRLLVIAPLTGTVTTITGAFDGNGIAPTAALSIAAAIGGVAIAGGPLSISSSGAASSRSLTAPNTTIIRSTVVVVTLTTTNATAGTLTITLGFTRQ